MSTGKTIVDVRTVQEFNMAMRLAVLIFLCRNATAGSNY
jgi:hypothetical protein